jgi:hypothetical protein
MENRSKSQKSIWKKDKSQTKIKIRPLEVRKRQYRRIGFDFLIEK